MPILLFKLLPNRNSDGVGTSLVREASFGGKIFDRYCLLMLFPSKFAIPGRMTTYLVTNWWLFSLSADFLGRKIHVIGSWKLETILSRILRNLLTRHLHQPNYSWLKWYRNLLYREPRSEEWSEECPRGQIKLFMFILLILLYSVSRWFKQSFFKIYRMNQSILEKIFNIKAPT